MPLLMGDLPYVDQRRLIAMIGSSKEFLHFTTRTHTNESDALILSLYVVFAVYHCFNGGKVYRRPHKALRPHIVSGTLELIMYYSDLQCSLAAVVACLVHSVTSLILVDKLPNGHPQYTRPSYQAGSYMRIALIVRAYLSEGPMDYHDAMMPLHGFIYTRVILFIIGIMGTSDHLKDNINDPMAYTLAVFGAATISVSHISSPWAIVWYLGTFTLIGIKNRWSSKLSRERQLIKSGPAQVQASFFTEKPSEIGDLPADQLGHLVMKLLDVLYQSLMGQIW